MERRHGGLCHLYFFFLLFSINFLSFSILFLKSFDIMIQGTVKFTCDSYLMALDFTADNGYTLFSFCTLKTTLKIPIFRVEAGISGDTKNTKQEENHNRVIRDDNLRRQP